MLSDLRPLGLVGAAKRLDVEPFELIRLLVATDGVPKDMVFPPAKVDALRARAGIEDSWWTDTELPEDVNPLRQRVRGALSLLLARGHVGGEGTRQDNVWRGLPAADQELVRNALLVLADEGLLALIPGKLSTRVTVSPAGEDRIRAIAEGRSDTSALSVLYEG